MGCRRICTGTGSYNGMYFGNFCIVPSVPPFSFDSNHVVQFQCTFLLGLLLLATGSHIVLHFHHVLPQDTLRPPCRKNHFISAIFVPCSYCTFQWYLTATAASTASTAPTIVVYFLQQPSQCLGSFFQRQMS